MPRVSKRKAAIDEIEDAINIWNDYRCIMYLLDWEGEAEEYDFVADCLGLMHEQAIHPRYLFRNPTNRKKPRRWHFLLHNTKMVNNSEFLNEFRMNRECFYSLLNLLQNSGRESEDYKKVEDVHLLTLLRFLGSVGSASSYTHIGCSLGIGYGSVRNYMNRAIDAILRLKNKTIFWPNVDERNEIAGRFNGKYSMINCVGIVDGTIFPLEYKPPLNGEDYYNRKGGYGLHSLVFCDDMARIREITLGWPGSVHDNRVWRRSRIFLNQEQFFNSRQYLIGDSAFHPSKVMVPSFKKPFGCDLDDYKMFFNTMIAKPRIRSEHCIGLLKGRFPYLKRIRILIRHRKDMIRINRIITTAAVLHNLMLDEDYPEDWIENEDSDYDDDSLTDDDGVNMVASEGERRERLFAYLCEKFI